MAARRDVRRYRPRLFRWLDFEDIAAAVVIVAFMWFCLVGLPTIMPRGNAGDVRAHIGGFAVSLVKAP